MLDFPECVFWEVLKFQISNVIRRFLWFRGPVMVIEGFVDCCKVPIWSLRPGLGL